MRKGFYLIGLAPLLFAGCETEPVVTTTTTEVRREIVQTRGDRVVGREVIVTKAPPAVQVERRPLRPEHGMSGHEATGAGLEEITYGCPAGGLNVREWRQSGWKANGNAVPTAGCGRMDAGNDIPLFGSIAGLRFAGMIHAVDHKI